MQKTTLFVLLALMFSAVAWRSQAADSSLSSADEKSLRAACDAYVNAVNSGDAAAIVKFWTEDADYVNDSGATFKGRAALSKLFKDNLPSLKDKKFSFNTKSLRSVAPGVVLEDGVGTLTGDEKDEHGPGTRYTAVWVRTGDQWLISSVRDLGDFAGDEKSASPLKQLDWMVGSWRSSNPEADVEMACTPILDGKFLRQKYEVKGKNGQEFTVITMIGWDHANGVVRSWFFDTRGGFGDGVWSREGNSWKIAAAGIVADGRHGTSTNIWKYTSDKTAVWTSKDRELEGMPMPESEVTFTRQQDNQSAVEASK